MHTEVSFEASTTYKASEMDTDVTFVMVITYMELMCCADYKSGCIVSDKVTGYGVNMKFCGRDKEQILYNKMLIHK